jgi:hypothetical protein
MTGEPFCWERLSEMLEAARLPEIEGEVDYEASFQAVTRCIDYVGAEIGRLAARGEKDEELERTHDELQQMQLKRGLLRDLGEAGFEQHMAVREADDIILDEIWKRARGER